MHLKPPWECLQLCLNTWRHRIWSVKPLPMWEGGSRGWGLVLALPGPFGLFVFTGGKPLCESVQKHEHGWPPRASAFWYKVKNEFTYLLSEMKAPLKKDSKSDRKQLSFCTRTAESHSQVTTWRKKFSYSESSHRIQASVFKCKLLPLSVSLSGSSAVIYNLSGHPMYFWFPYLAIIKKED